MIEVVQRKTDVIALRKLMAENGINTVISLSESSGIDRNTLGKTLNGERQPSAEAMEKLIQALGIEPKEAGEIFFKANLRNK